MACARPPLPVHKSTAHFILMENNSSCPVHKLTGHFHGRFHTRDR